MSLLLHAIRILFLAALGGWLAYSVVTAIRTGAADAGNTLHSRSERPFLFWFTLAIQAALAAICFFLFWSAVRE